MSERFSEKLRCTYCEDWKATTHHAFVNELLKGVISNERMAHYLVQDHRFINNFLILLGSAIASADNFAARIRFGNFIGMIASDENTYFLRCFKALDVSEKRRQSDPDSAPTRDLNAHMLEAANTMDYTAILAVITVCEWVYLDWGLRAAGKYPSNFIHAEWITLHDNDFFQDFVGFLRSELDRVGKTSPETAHRYFSKTIELERAFFDASYNI